MPKRIEAPMQANASERTRITDSSFASPTNEHGSPTHANASDERIADKRIVFSISIRESLANRLRRFACSRNSSASSVVEELIERFFKTKIKKAHPVKVL